MRSAAFFLLLASAVAVFWAHGPVERPLPSGITADHVEIHKRQRRLILLRAGAELRRYTVALGKRPEGQKQRAGDNRTPEGDYFIDARSEKTPHHRLLHLSYPNARDLDDARARGADLIDEISIHGLPAARRWMGRFHRWFDWTDGSIALTNEEMNELWRAVRDGTPVVIRP